jgi:hypothetical protein
MTPMLIFNAVLMVLIAVTILSVLAWGIVTDRARGATLARRRSRVRQRSVARPERVGRGQYARVPGLSS